MTKKHGAPPIFVSHAHRDQVLAERFVGLLNKGLGVDPDTEVFNSPNAWTETRLASNTWSKVQRNLTKSVVRIALITPNFLRSETCNAELGYMWASDDPEAGVDFIPLACNLPKDTDKLPWYTRPMELSDLLDPADLDHMAEIVIRRLGKRGFRKNWETLRERFRNDAQDTIIDVPEAINYDTMRKFLDACERNPRIVFFNIQVSFEDWFRPELQTHLALQDAATTFYQLQTLVNVDDTDGAPASNALQKLPRYFGTPTARVLFVAESRDELRKMLKHPTDPRARSFVDLVLIHLFMATPLALVTVDQLDDIMRQPYDPSKPDELDFSDKAIAYDNVLHLPRFRGKRDEKAEEAKLKQSMSEMIAKTRENDPGIDFALLMNNDNHKEVWRACISSGDLVYYPLAAPSAVDIFSKFGKTIEHAVFKSWKSAAELGNDMKLEAKLPADNAGQELRRFHHLLAARHPGFKVFHRDGDAPSIRRKFFDAMKFVRPQFCPLKLLEDTNRWQSVFDLYRNV